MQPAGKQEGSWPGTYLRVFKTAMDINIGVMSSTIRDKNGIGKQ